MAPIMVNTQHHVTEQASLSQGRNTTTDDIHSVSPALLPPSFDKEKLLTMQAEECEYSILPVMSELSTVRCDRALGLWIASTRASSVDGELPARSSGRAAAVASTPGSRAQATTEGGFLGFRHKTKQTDGCRRRQVVEARVSASGLTEATGIDGV